MANFIKLIGQTLYVRHGQLNVFSYRPIITKLLLQAVLHLWFLLFLDWQFGVYRCFIHPYCVEADQEGRELYHCLNETA